MLPREGPVTTPEIRHLSAQSPDDVSVFAGDLVNGVDVSGREEVVTVGGLINRVGVAVQSATERTIKRDVRSIQEIIILTSILHSIVRKSTLIKPNMILRIPVKHNLPRLGIELLKMLILSNAVPIESNLLRLLPRRFPPIILNQEDSGPVLDEMELVGVDDRRIVYLGLLDYPIRLVDKRTFPRFLGE